MKNHKINNHLKTPTDKSEMNSNNSELIIKNIRYKFLSCKTFRQREVEQTPLCHRGSISLVPQKNLAKIHSNGEES